LKTTYTKERKLLKLVIIDQTKVQYLQEFRKDQFLDHYFFSYILMTLKIVVNIIFKSSNKKCDTEMNIQLNHNTIQQVTHVKFLGLIIDQNLTWKNHINSVLKNIIKATALIAKLRHYTNRNTLKLIYYALVYPFLTHGNLTWGNTYPTRLQKLLNVQKKLLD
jgi:hypothetical protein